MVDAFPIRDADLLHSEAGLVSLEPPDREAVLPVGTFHPLGIPGAHAPVLEPDKVTAVVGMIVNAEAMAVGGYATAAPLLVHSPCGVATVLPGDVAVFHDHVVVEILLEISHQDNVLGLEVEHLGVGQGIER